MSENIVTDPILERGDSSTGDLANGQVGTPQVGGVSPSVVPHKKFPLITILLLILLSLLATFSIYLFLQVRTLTLEKTTSSSPTASAIALASADPTADWQTYTNSKYNFTFKYPSDWIQTQYLPHTPDVITFQPKLGYDAKSTANSIVLDISQACLNTQCLTKYSLDEMVANRSAKKIDELKVDDITTYKTNLTAGDIAYMLVNEDNFIQLSTVNQPTVLDKILSTFKFTDNSLSIPLGTCTHTYQVETNTEELTAKQNYSMRCAEQRSKKDCLSIDIYNQKADDFSIPDKISDCAWQDSISTQ